MKRIDLNCDMGESYGAWKMGADAEVMPHISSANIACGFHGGDPPTIRKTVRLAVDHGVAIGAHPSLPHLQGFGRRVMKISPQEMYDLVVYQAGALGAFARAAGAQPHGGGGAHRRKEKSRWALPKLFTPIQLGGITLPNRIVVSPMCQYVADDGCMNDWHLIHLGHLAYSGAGLLMVEATHVTREGRITHGCSGLYNEHNEAELACVIQACRRLSKNPIGIQLAHAGRKGSSQVPWAGREWLRADQSPWQTVAPSPIPYGEGWHVPHELSVQEIRTQIEAFVAATLRSKRIGFDVVELHSAHGYLIHQFLSPLSNQRKAAHGRDRSKRSEERRVGKECRSRWSPYH